MTTTQKQTILRAARKFNCRRKQKEVCTCLRKKYSNFELTVTTKLLVNLTKSSASGSIIKCANSASFIVPLLVLLFLTIVW